MGNDEVTVSDLIILTKYYNNSVFAKCKVASFVNNLLEKHSPLEIIENKANAKILTDYLKQDFENCRMTYKKNGYMFSVTTSKTKYIITKMKENDPYRVSKRELEWNVIAKNIVVLCQKKEFLTAPQKDLSLLFALEGYEEGTIAGQCKTIEELEQVIAKLYLDYDNAPLLQRYEIDTMEEFALNLIYNQSFITDSKLQFHSKFNKFAMNIMATETQEVQNKFYLWLHARSIVENAKNCGLYKFEAKVFENDERRTIVKQEVKDQLLQNINNEKAHKHDLNLTYLMEKLNEFAERNGYNQTSRMDKVFEEEYDLAF